MKIAVSVMRPNLNSQVDPRFARCRHVLFVDLETMDFEPMENPNLMGLGGGGTQLAQLVISNGAQALLTGQIGPAAQQMLSQAKIEVYTGVRGTAKAAVDSYNKGLLTAAPPLAAEVSGAEAAPEEAAAPRRTAPPPPAVRGDVRVELAELKSQLQTLSRQLAEIQRRVDELEKAA